MFLVSFHCSLHISKSSRLPPLGISNPTYSATILHWGSSVSPFLTFACTVVFFFKISREAHENWASVSFIGSVYHERLSSWHKPLVLCSPRWYHNVRFNCRLLLWTAGFRQTRSLAHSSLVLGAAHGKEKTTLYLLKNRFPSGKHFRSYNEHMECLLWVLRVQRWANCSCQLVSELRKLEAIPFVSLFGPPRILRG